jgi:hypothetical protein
VIERCGREVTRLFEIPALADDRISDRKRRLFAVACLRRFGDQLLDPRSQRALIVAERYAEGLASEEERQRAEDDAFEAHAEMRAARFSAETLLPWSWRDEQLTRASALIVSHGVYYAEDAAEYARRALLGPTEAEEEAVQCRLLEDIVGPWPDIEPVIDPLWLECNDRAVLHLARCAYQHEDFAVLPILADALEEAGCADIHILDHLRGNGSHVRGCWVLDLLLSAYQRFESDLRLALTDLRIIKRST